MTATLRYPPLSIPGPLGVLLAILMATVTTGAGCRSEPEGEPPPPAEKPTERAEAETATGQTPAKPETQAPIPPTADAVVEAPAPGPPLKAEVRRIAMERGKRPQCNDLTGCPMVGTLIALGPNAAAAVEDAYQTSKGDGHWRFRLLEVVGRLRQKRSGPFLLGVLRTDRYPKARAEAALALARVGDRKNLPALQTIAAGLTAEAFRPALLATGYAMAALGDKAGRALIEKHLVVPEGEYRRWDKLRPGVFAAGQLRMKGLRPRLEAIMKRADPFVRREAARALGAMRDRGALPALVQVLKDPVPGVRNEALRSLKALTGFRHKSTHEQWSRWLAEQESAEKKRAKAPPVPRKSAPTP